MSDFTPILPRKRRLEIILHVKQKMVEARLARGDTQAAARMAEFYDRIYAVVEGAGSGGVHGWATAGLDQLEAPQKARAAPARHTAQPDLFIEPQRNDPEPTTAEIHSHDSPDDFDFS